MCSLQTQLNIVPISMKAIIHKHQHEPAAVQAEKHRCPANRTLIQNDSQGFDCSPEFGYLALPLPCLSVQGDDERSAGVLQTDFVLLYRPQHKAIRSQVIIQMPPSCNLMTAYCNMRLCTSFLIKKDVSGTYTAMRQKPPTDDRWP